MTPANGSTGVGVRVLVSVGRGVVACVCACLCVCMRVLGRGLVRVLVRLCRCARLRTYIDTMRLANLVGMLRREFFWIRKAVWYFFDTTIFRTPSIGSTARASIMNFDMKSNPVKKKINKMGKYRNDANMGSVALC